MTMRMEQKNILRIDNMSLKFGGVDVLNGIRIDVQTGELLAIIGPNGAGKTCILNCINGFYHPNTGKIFYKNTNITKIPSHRIASIGIARVFQNIELYTGLTVLENLMAARHIRMRQNIFEGAIFFGRSRKEEISHRKVVEEIIDFLEIQDIRKSIVGTLSYGLRKRVELGRALALEPSILLLDEPMAGMNLEEKEDMSRFILDILEQRTGMSVVLVEHDIGVVMDIADRIIVVDNGIVLAEGLPQQIATNPDVIKAYLGDQEYVAT